MGAHTDPLKWIFLEITFRPLGVLPRQIFTRAKLYFHSNLRRPAAPSWALTHISLRAAYKMQLVKWTYFTPSHTVPYVHLYFTTKWLMLHYNS